MVKEETEFCARNRTLHVWNWCSNALPLNEKRSFTIDTHTIIIHDQGPADYIQDLISCELPTPCVKR